jgi:hypothetical protein
VCSEAKSLTTTQFFEVTLNPNGGVITETVVRTNNVDRLSASGTPVPTRDGHIFEGWYTEITGGTLVRTGGFDGTVFTRSMTVHARWTQPPNGIVITFNPHEGNMGTAPTSVLIAENSSLPSLPTPTRTNHEFLGWFTGSRGGTRVSTDMVFAASETIHARWRTTNIISTGDFPSFHITTDPAGGAPFTERTLWIDSTFSMRGAGNTEFNFEGVTGDIRGRGRSSWDFAEKRSLRVRFDERHAMLDSGYMNRRWVLIANHFDKSLIRNYAAYHFASQLDGMCWAPYHRFVHLYVNGSYHGVYLLTDERRVEPGRAEITGHADPRISEYFIEMEHRLWEDSGRPALADEWRHGYVRVNTSLPQGQFRGGSGTPSGGGSGTPDRLYEVRFPDEDDITQAHFEYVQQFLDNVGRTIRSRDWNRIQAVIDIPSMIDFMIVQELTQNADVSHASQFMKIKGQGTDRKLHMGMVWDFDLGALNHSWMWDRGFFTPYGEFITGEHYWYENLMAIPQFRELMRQRWNTVATPALANTIAHVRDYTTTHRAAFERNFTRWQVLGQPVWVMPGFGGTSTMTPRAMMDITTFRGHVDYVLDYMERRGRYLSEGLNGRDSLGGRRAIYFDLNLGSSFGASGSVNPVGMMTDANGRLTGTLPTPTRSGGFGAQPTFQGWFTEPTGGVQVTSSTVFREHGRIYARWSGGGGFW